MRFIVVDAFSFFYRLVSTIFQNKTTSRITCLIWFGSTCPAKSCHTDAVAMFVKAAAYFVISSFYIFRQNIYRKMDDPGSHSKRKRPSYLADFVNSDGEGDGETKSKKNKKKVINQVNRTGFS